MIDDGTVTRVADQAFRWTAADPNLRWLTENASGLNVRIEDISESVAALALQGPTSARLLRQVCDADLWSLKYFRATSGHIAGVPVDISRTGYTGDLGYEIWMPWDAALARLGRDRLERVTPSTCIRPACWRSTSRASRPGCC